MASIDIQLPEDLRSYVDRQAKNRGQDSSAYIQSLIEAERVRNLRGEIEASLLEACRSPSSPWTSQDLAEIRKAGLVKIEGRQAR